MTKYVMIKFDPINCLVAVLAPNWGLGVKYKKQQAYKPGFVFRLAPKRLSFILDTSRPAPPAIYPPASDELSYMRRYTWSCNP